MAFRPGFDILVVDDEADIRELVSELLEDEGYSTRTANDGDKAIEEVMRRRPSLVVLDVWLQGSRLDGLEVLDILRQRYPELPVVIISGHGNIETAVDAIKKGAYDYIEKPFKADRLLLVATRAIEASKLKRENRQLREQSQKSDELIGSSGVMNRLRQDISKVAPTNSRVVITGPPGSGKELVARTMHANSLRCDAPFVVLSAAAMTPENVEEELFGVEGEVNNADRRVGALEEAHGGTLFMDEIADMPMETQGKILRVLVEQKFQRMGGAQKINVDVRVVSSSAKDLEQAMDAGLFRRDLYHRLNVVPLVVMPLNEHREDIPDLVQFFVAQISASSGLAPREIGEDAIAVLQSHDWPGNVRQLRNAVEQMMIMARGDITEPIDVTMLPTNLTGGDDNVGEGYDMQNYMSMPLRDARSVFEREYLLAQVNRFGGNVSRTAEFVGMERSALHRKLRALGVRKGDAE
jgi:two-component system nitrogen regulation response regulator NtrX